MRAKYLILFLLLSLKSQATVYSILIGVADYKYIPIQADLKYSDDDVIHFYKFLTTDLSVPEANVYILTNQQASYDNIIKATNFIFKKAKKDDLVIFYFSGHGDNGKILPYDYDGSNNGLSFKKLAELFRNCASENKIIFADACRIGGLKPQKNEKKSTITDKIIAMVSCRANENSIEHGYIKQGFFSYFLLEGLKGNADLNKDRKLTILELHRFVKRNVSAVSQNTQNPITFGNFPLNHVILTY